MDAWCWDEDQLRPVSMRLEGQKWSGDTEKRSLLGHEGTRQQRNLDILSSTWDH
jgi:hypothetical protein